MQMYTYIASVGYHFTSLTHSLPRPYPHLYHRFSRTRSNTHHTTPHRPRPTTAYPTTKKRT